MWRPPHRYSWTANWTFFEVTDWDALCEPHGQDIDGLTECITYCLNFCVDCTFPTRTVCCYPNNKPWVTKDIKAILNEKARTFRGDKREELSDDATSKDYRPVALMSHIMKTPESLVLEHLRPMVRPHLDPLQFAYQPRIGVEDFIIYLLNRVYAHLDKPASTVRVRFFELSSAFNTGDVETTQIQWGGDRWDNRDLQRQRTLTRMQRKDKQCWNAVTANPQRQRQPAGQRSTRQRLTIYTRRWWIAKQSVIHPWLLCYKWLWRTDDSRLNKPWRGSSHLQHPLSQAGQRIKNNRQGLHSNRHWMGSHHKWLNNNRFWRTGELVWLFWWVTEYANGTLKSWITSQSTTSLEEQGMLVQEGIREMCFSYSEKPDKGCDILVLEELIKLRAK